MSFEYDSTYKYSGRASNVPPASKVNEPRKVSVDGDPLGVFYKPAVNVILFFRVFVLLFVVIFVLVTFYSPKLRRVNVFCSILIDFNLILRSLTRSLLRFAKRYNAFTELLTLLKNGFDDLLKLALPLSPKWVRWLINRNTLNTWILGSLFIGLFLLVEWILNTVETIVMLVQARFSPRYCVNAVHPSFFHYRDSSFTKKELSKLFKSPEYLKLKDSRRGLGAEAWNWQLRRSATRYARGIGISHVKNEFDSDEE